MLHRRTEARGRESGDEKSCKQGHCRAEGRIDEQRPLQRGELLGIEGEHYLAERRAAACGGARGVCTERRRGIELCLRHHFLAEEPALLVARTIGTGAPAIECEGHLARTARRGQHPSGGVEEEHDARGTRRTDIALGKTGQRSVVPDQQREFGGTGQIGGFTLTARLELGLRAIQTAGREPDAEGQRRCEGG